MTARIGSGFWSFWAGISAVSVKELRGRMRGRRAFAVVTIYLLLLSAFAFGIYAYMREQAALELTFIGGQMFSGRDDAFLTMAEPGYALAARIGHSVFTGLLLVETLLVLFLAPAFTAGAISLEREKQTIDLLVTTPVSTLGMVIGKLFSALSYVFLLILASVPLMAVVFVFGGVGPEDVIRAYLLLLALAFGMGAIGLFVSALVRRTQTATVLTFVVVLALTMGSAAVYEFWTVVATRAAAPAEGNFVQVQKPNRAPSALLWLNPFVGDLDLICTTAPGGTSGTCGYVATVTGTPWFGSALTEQKCGPDGLCAVAEGVVGDGGGLGLANVGIARGRAADPVNLDQVASAEVSFGFPRDTFWPQNAVAFLGLGALLTLLSAQLVAPTRRMKLFRPRMRRSDHEVLP